MTGHSGPAGTTRRHHASRHRWIVPGIVGVLALAGCSDDKPTPVGPSTTSPTGASSSGGSASGSSSPAGAAMPAPAWQRVANYIAPQDNGKRRALVRLYPLQRLDGHVLLTVDLTPQDGKARGTDYFCLEVACRDLGGVTLLDTQRLVEYQPLQSTGGKAFPAITSEIDSFELEPGTTYRLGAYFPDPGGSSTTVNLLYGGVAPDVPIVDGGQPAAGLVAAGSGDTDKPSPAPGGPDGTSLVTYPVRPPAADAVTVSHDIVARVAGGTVNEGAGRRAGTVSVNADVLFAFNSAALSPRAKSLILQAANLLATRADLAKPVQVVGYTDSVGGDAYNLTLSTARAKAVAAALTATGRLARVSLTTSGRGSADPVAPNTVGGGADNPSGRALNRRVELHFAPKPVAAPASPTASPSSAPASGESSSADAAGTGESADPSPAATLPRRDHVHGEQQAFSAAVYPVQRRGGLTLAQVDVTPVGTAASGRGYFSVGSIASYDVGSFSLEDPATKRVYVPAMWAEDLAAKDRSPRLVASWVQSGMNADVPFRLYFWTAALPSQLGSVTVHLGELGTVTVPVRS